MADRISEETMEYVGILSKLELSAEEKVKAGKDMETMLNYIDRLNELDTSGVEPMTHIFETENVMRDDVVTNGDRSEEMLMNAPKKHNMSFVVPKTVE